MCLLDEKPRAAGMSAGEANKAFAPNYIAADAARNAQTWRACVLLDSEEWVVIDRTFANGLTPAEKKAVEEIDEAITALKQSDRIDTEEGEQDLDRLEDNRDWWAEGVVCEAISLTVCSDPLNAEGSAVYQENRVKMWGVWPPVTERAEQTLRAMNANENGEIDEFVESFRWRNPA
jgi:hypothetical protein